MEESYSNTLNKNWLPTKCALVDALQRARREPAPTYRPVRVMSRAQYLWEIRMERVWSHRYWMGKV